MVSLALSELSYISTLVTAWSRYSVSGGRSAYARYTGSGDRSSCIHNRKRSLTGLCDQAESGQLNVSRNCLRSPLPFSAIQEYNTISVMPAEKLQTL